jgi:hypothetical protein
MEEPTFQVLHPLPAFQVLINNLLMTPRGDSQSSPPPSAYYPIPEEFVVPEPVQNLSTSSIQKSPQDETSFPSVALPVQQTTAVPSIYPSVIPIDTPESSIASEPSTPVEPLDLYSNSSVSTPTFADTPEPQQPEPMPQSSSSAAATVTVTPQPVREEQIIDAGYKFYEQMAQLWGMGFFEVPRLRELLEKHNGNVSLVVFDLIQ